MVCALCGVETHPRHDESAQHLQSVLQVWDRYAAAIARRVPSERAEPDELPSMPDSAVRASVDRMPLSADEKEALLRKASAGEYAARYVIAVRQECVRQLNALAVGVTEARE